MDVYLTEEEQWEAIKRWIKQYGPAIIIGIILSVGINFGWRHWQQGRTAKAEQASILYEETLASLKLNKTKDFQSNVEKLQADYTDTPYAGLSALLQAQQAINKNQLGSAEHSLRWAMGKGSSDKIKQVARLRVARVLLAQNHPEQAINVLNHVDNQGYLAAIDELKGDAYLALNKAHEARQAYQEAVDYLTMLGVTRPLLNMKLNQVIVENLSHQTS